MISLADLVYLIQVLRIYSFIYSTAKIKTNETIKQIFSLSDINKNSFHPNASGTTNFQISELLLAKQASFLFFAAKSCFITGNKALCL